MGNKVDNDSEQKPKRMYSSTDTDRKRADQLRNKFKLTLTRYKLLAKSSFMEQNP